MVSYQEFLAAKTPARKAFGFSPVYIPDFLFDFQKDLVEWAIKQGRCGLFESCGAGKTIQFLVWAENIIRKTNGNVLVLSPLAVAPQTVKEAEKFGIEAKRSKQGQVHRGITVTNYHRLEHYNPGDFVGVVADESSVLKHESSQTRKAVTRFLREVPYRLLCTATPAPNDYMELGTSSEALGVMGRNQMLGMFFTNDGESTQQWRLKGHAKKRFWQWVASWARAIRKPSDLGYPDGKFKLPPLQVKLHKVESKIKEGFFPKLARTLSEQRLEKRESLEKRCQKVAEVLPTDRPCLVWCQLNSEGNLLSKLISGAVQVAGSDSEDKKEETINAFASGQVRCLVSKPSICSFGLNLQSCADISYYPSWSHEQYHQAVRRCWRFGQKNPVTVNLVYSESESVVLNGMLQKERQSDELYSGILREMSEFQTDEQPVAKNGHVETIEVPSWLRK